VGNFEVLGVIEFLSGVEGISESLDEKLEINACGILRVPQGCSFGRASGGADSYRPTLFIDK